MSAPDIIERWYAALNAGDEDALDALADAAMTTHQSGYAMRADALRGFRAGYRCGFPDLQIDFEILRAAPDFAAVRTITAGTHTGRWLGHEPTDRSFRAEGLDFFRLGEGRILEMWSAFDTEGMLRQLGLRGGA